MKMISSGFSDISILKPDEKKSEFRRIKERFQIDQNTAVGKMPLFMFEGEIFIEREKTLAGMYFQREHDWYAQLIRCSLGSVFLAALDIRKESKTFGKSKLFYISEENEVAIYLPQGFAVGYLTKKENSMLIIKTEKRYEAKKELNINPLDPKLNIRWPEQSFYISAKDRYAPDFSEVERIILTEKIEEFFFVEDIYGKPQNLSQ